MPMEERRIDAHILLANHVDVELVALAIHTAAKNGAVKPHCCRSLNSMIADLSDSYFDWTRGKTPTKENAVEFLKYYTERALKQ